MKPVIQTKFYDKEAGLRGNCLQAAVASILELPLDAVPNFQEAPEECGFWGYFTRTMRSFGFEPVDVSNREPQCLYLAHGDSPRGVKHSVIMREGALVHDPHPSGAGLLSIDYITLLVPIDPARRCD